MFKWVGAAKMTVKKNCQCRRQSFPFQIDAGVWVNRPHRVGQRAGDEFGDTLRRGDLAGVGVTWVSLPITHTITIIKLNNNNNKLTN